MKKVKKRFCIILPISLMAKIKTQAKSKGITYSRWIDDAIRFTLKFAPHSQPPISQHILKGPKVRGD